MISPIMSQSHVLVRSQAQRRVRRGSVDHDRTSQGLSKDQNSTELLEKFRQIRALPTPGTSERDASEQERPSRRSFAFASDRSSQYRIHPDEEDRQRRATKHRRDGSAPASYDTSRRQRIGPGGSVTSSQDELKGRDRAQDSFAARVRQSPESPAKSKSARSFPVSSSDGGRLTRSQSNVSGLGARRDKSTIDTSSTPGSEAPAITAAMVRSATTTSTPDGSLNKKRESQAPTSNTTSNATLSSNGDANAASNARDLNSICQEFEAIVDTQNKRLARVEERDKQMKQDNLSLRHDLQLLQQKYDGLLEKNREILDKNGELEARAEDLQDLLASKATPTTNSGASLIPDTQVQGRWNSLCFDIRQCVTEHVNPTGSLSHIHERVFYGFHSLTPSHVTLFLRDREGCRLVAQAIIWRILAEHVFGNGARMSRMFWAGKFSENVRCLSDGTLGTCVEQTKFKEFHGWRRHTATFLSDLAAPKDIRAHIDRIIANTEDSLKFLLPVPWPPALRVRFQEIIDSAIWLDCDLSQQWAYWYVDYPDLPEPDRNGYQPFQRFDNTLMKVPKNQDPGQFVGFMISPVLFKAGDSRGQGYEEKGEPACKCEVICVEDPQPNLPSPLWQYYRLPPGVPLVVDPRTQRVRQQHKHTSGGTENRASPGRRLLQLIGI